MNINYDKKITWESAPHDEMTRIAKTGVHNRLTGYLQNESWAGPERVKVCCVDDISTDAAPRFRASLLRQADYGMPVCYKRVFATDRQSAIEFCETFLAGWGENVDAIFERE